MKDKIYRTYIGWRFAVYRKGLTVERCAGGYKATSKGWVVARWNNGEYGIVSDHRLRIADAWDDLRRGIAGK